MNLENKIEELLVKYNVAGPRYTSYPTVPAWTEEVGPQDYHQSLLTLKADETLSLYFHLPFCENLCHFCGCMQVITKDHSRSLSYVQTLLKEIDDIVGSIKVEKMKVSQIHFGGGTPNFLQPQELTMIMDKINQEFEILSDAEIAIEMHPRTSTTEFCQNLKTLGFNRISLGVQDFDDHVQKLINRHQTYDMTRDMVEELRDLGFDSFNFDLVYGLPGQTMEGWENTIEKVIGLKPNRLAVYSYAHVPWVRPVQRTFKDEDIPVPEMKVKFFSTAYEQFLSHGYQLIGMDHFALEDDDLSKSLNDGTIHRNFMGYSTKADAHQIGFGVSSISYVGGNYFQNLKRIQDYLKTIESGDKASFRGIILDKRDHIKRDLITQIMCNGFVNWLDFNKKWNMNYQESFSHEINQLNGMVEDGLLELNEKELKVKGMGFLFLRNVAMVFDDYLSGIKSQAKNPTFSKTV